MWFFRKFRSAFAGFTAGCVNGLFGAGGGMLLVPLLSGSEDFSDREVFSSSIVIILPICLVSLFTGAGWQLPWKPALPYLIGSIPGGILAAVLSKKLNPLWLHRILGVLIVYGGLRYLW